MSGLFEPVHQLIEANTLVDGSVPFSDLSSPTSGELDFVEFGISSHEAFDFFEVHVSITVLVSEFEGSTGNFFSSDFSISIDIKVVEGHVDNFADFFRSGIDAMVVD